MALGDLERILLVEDDRVDVMTVKRAFRENEVHVELHVRRDGGEGLEALRSEDIDHHRLLVLLDLNMPRVSGLEFLAELRADDDLRRIPVVVLTTSDEEEDMVEAYDLNVAGYMLKPVTYEQFRELVERITSYWAVNRLV